MKAPPSNAPAPPPAHAARAWIWALTITLSVYAASSTDRLTGGDSGELLAEACVGGNAHPPGYPLLLLALRAVRTVGSYVCPHVRFVVLANYLNAAFAAGAAACLAHAVELLAGYEETLEAVAAGLLFAFSALTWEYALGLEVFALNNLLVGLLLVCFLEHHVRGYKSSKVTLYAGALVCGLGLANQHTIVLFEIPLIVWIVATTKLQAFDWGCLTLAFAAGLSPYSYTYAAAQTPTKGSWGDASTPQGLLTHILRREYGTFQLSPRQGASDVEFGIFIVTLSTRLGFYAADLISEFTPFGVICAFVGMASVLAPTSLQNPARMDSAARVLLLALIGYLLVFNSLANLPLEDPLAREVTRRFFLQPNMLVALVTGIGMVSLRRMIESKLRSRTLSQLVGAASMALVAHQILRNREQFTSSLVARHDLLRDFGASILRTLPKNALLLSYTDVQWNTVRYLQECEHKRPDVVHLNLQIMAFPWFERQHSLYPQVVFPPTLSDISTNRSSQGYATYLSQFMQANVRDHNIFLDLHGVDESTIGSEQLLFGHIQVLPRGLVWQVVQIGGGMERLRDAWQAYATQPSRKIHESLLVDCCGIASHVEPLSTPRGSWEFVVVSIAHDAMYQHNLAKLGYWLAHGTIQSFEQLEETIVASDTIQYELSDIVWVGIQNSGGAITYDFYAVEKNAIVSRQRFQLYLETLANLHEEGHIIDFTNPRTSVLLKEREPRRDKTITQVENFLNTMERQRDGDTDAVRHGLQTLKSKRSPAKQATPATEKALRESRKRKKRHKAKNTKRN